MAKVVLNNLSSLSNEASAISIINANNDAIEAAMEKTLSRDDTQPNQMTYNLDMNGQQIYNLSEPITETSPVRVIDLVDPEIAITIPGTGTSGHVVPFLDGNNTWSGTNTYNQDVTFNDPVTFTDTVQINNELTFISPDTKNANSTSFYITGDIKQRYGTGTLTGWVRCNGLTIGSASSSATELASADAEDLFKYLWDTDSSLVVSGGRGSTASADWSANKNIALPDFRSRGLVGLSDMGNSSSTLLDGITFTTGDDTTLGSTYGNALRTLLQTHLPNVNFTVSIPSGQGAHTHGLSTNVLVFGGPTLSVGANGGASFSTVNALSSTLPAMSGTAASGGSGTAFGTVPPSSMVTIYIKL